MADDDAVHRGAGGAREVGDLLRLVGVAAGMSIERGTRLGLCDERRAHDLLLLRRPGRLAADLADNAGARRGAPGADRDLLDDLACEVVDAAVGNGGVMVFLDIMAAAHDDVDAGVARQPHQAVRVGANSAGGQLDQSLAAGFAHPLKFAPHQRLIVQAEVQGSVDRSPPDIEAIANRQGVIAAHGLGAKPRWVEIRRQMLVHQCAAERGRRDEAGHGLHSAAQRVA
jgi:hypothetical protein